MLKARKSLQWSSSSSGSELMTGSMAANKWKRQSLTKLRQWLPVCPSLNSRSAFFVLLNGSPRIVLSWKKPIFCASGGLCNMIQTFVLFWKLLPSFPIITNLLFDRARNALTQYYVTQLSCYSTLQINGLIQKNKQKKRPKNAEKIHLHKKIT